MQQFIDDGLPGFDGPASKKKDEIKHWKSELENGASAGEIVKEFFAAGKPVAAICHGPQVLAAAGVLKGYKATAYPAVGPDVTLAGGTYVPVNVDEAVVDRNLVTAPAWPGDTAIVREFAALMGAKIEI